ncbi:hypothetical protein Dsin_010193 [Dipteronia sinensis]|uniref:RNase H type-1 domain-containing protein n=1 Tax=Dipteronia sinensis TaxID=43782 RepID=A0AAE0AS31_9ROSI|nr:hypothetical protein Dsin_010193 [Dipteronia sinensis]
MGDLAEVHEDVGGELLSKSERCVESHGAKKAAHVVWITPALGSLKFNVDGSARGSLGITGIGGVLRNSNGKVLCIFSEWIGIQDSNTAEILAIHKACSLCVSNIAYCDKKIVICSDSKVAVS